MEELKNTDKKGISTKRNIGKTTYEVVVHLNENATETMQDKLTRIMLRELRRKSNEKKMILIKKSLTSGNRYNGTYCLNARRENKECSRKPRAVRIKVILEEVYKALGELKFDEKDYRRHLKDLKEYVDIKLDKLIVEKRSLLDTKRRKQTKINEHATTYSKFDSMTPEIVKQKVREQIEMLQEDLINIEQELAKVESQIIDPEGLKMNQEKFLNSLNVLEQQMRARNPVVKDLLAREILLNWEIDQQNRVFYRCKDPIELTHKYIKSTFGAPDCPMGRSRQAKNASFWCA